MKLRRFNPSGVEEFRRHLLEMKEDPSREPPWHLLDDPRFTEQGPVRTDVERTALTTRMAAARAVDHLLGSPPPAGVANDAGLWSWLTLAHFDSACPPIDGNGRKVGAIARYIPEGADHKRYYRHLLLGPYLVFRAHHAQPERALILLCQPLHSPGDIVEQLVSRQELVTNPVIVRVATELYYDPNTGMPKRGAGGKTGGSARRLAEVADQFDVTWDLFAMPWESLLARLPKEFDRFRHAGVPA
jgi:hypothetical protein